MFPRFALVLLLCLGMIASARAQTTTVYAFAPGDCVHADNCTMYANNETQSLWWDYSSANTGFVIFELASWDPSYHALNEFVCGDGYITPGGSVGVATFTGSGGSCRNIDSASVPFTMSYSFKATPYEGGGSGKGGGGAGIRYAITDLTVSITSAVPEPMSSALLLVGLILIGRQAGKGSPRTSRPDIQPKHFRPRFL